MTDGVGQVGAQTQSAGASIGQNRYQNPMGDGKRYLIRI